MGERRLCKVPGCKRPYGAKDYCLLHWHRVSRTGQPGPVEPLIAPRQPGVRCAIAGCSKKIEARGWCQKHYMRWRKHRDPQICLQEKGRMGDGSITQGGYRWVYAKGHPNAQRKGGIFEHRLVMSRLLGRPLLPGEEVHHRNGVRLDNRPENLELWITSQPAGQRVEDVLAWAEEIIFRYGKTHTQLMLLSKEAS